MNYCFFFFLVPQLGWSFCCHPCVSIVGLAEPASRVNKNVNRVRAYKTYLTRYHSSSLLYRTPLLSPPLQAGRGLPARLMTATVDTVISPSLSHHVITTPPTARGISVHCVFAIRDTPLVDGTPSQRPSEYEHQPSGPNEGLASTSRFGRPSLKGTGK